MNGVLLSKDIKKIEQACIKNPLGSYQMGEIARLSGILYIRGVDVIDLLNNACDIYGVDKCGKK